jgi:RHS repeat-associated protein
MTTITDALGGKVTIGFDAAGQQTSVVNPRGDTTSFTHDPLGNVASQTNPAGKITTMTYDAAGRLITKVNARGISISYGYDAADHQTSTIFPGGSLGYAYDAIGRRTTMTDPTGTTSFTYDAASNVTAVAAPQGTVSYAYDSANRRTAMTLPGARTLSYSYDAANQLTGLTDWFNQATTIGYTPDGLRSVMTRPAGVKTSYGYDNADRLTSVNNDGPSGPLKDFSYTLDAAGNRTSMTSSAGTESYTLDVLNRLTQVTYANGDKISYTYDAAGNRLTQTVNGVATNYSYNSAGQLQTVGATTYSYDADGNLIGAGADSFNWDWAGRLSGATVGGTASSYTYDGGGTRVAAKVGAASTTSYLWDRQTSLPLLLDDGSRGYVESGGVLEQLDGGGASSATYPLADALGSVRGLSNGSASVVGSADYEVFGAVRARTGASTIFGFTGEQTDRTGLIFLRARYLDTGLGRFLSPDTVFPNFAGTQGYNLYLSSADNPTTNRDPSGHTFPETGVQAVTEQWFARWASNYLARYIIRRYVTRFLFILASALGGAAVGVGTYACLEFCPRPQLGSNSRPSAPPTTQPNPAPITAPTPGAAQTPSPEPAAVLVYRLLDGNNTRLPSNPNTQRGQFVFRPTMSTFESDGLDGNPAATTKPYMLELRILLAESPARTPGNTGIVGEVPLCTGTYEPPPPGHWGITCTTADPSGAIQGYARSETARILRNPLYGGSYAPGAP